MSEDYSQEQYVRGMTGWDLLRSLSCCGLAWVAFLSSALRGSDTVLLPKRQDAYFAMYCHTHAQFFHLRADGKYTRVSREHLFLEESDSGTWEQHRDGWLSLTSERRLRSVIAGPVAVELYAHDHDLPIGDRLPGLRERIQAFLADDQRQRFDWLDLRALSTDLEDDPWPPWPLVTPLKGGKVTRQHLVSLAEEIQTYIASASKHVFRARPVRVGSLVFLFQDGWGVYDTPEELAESCRFREHSDRPEWDESCLLPAFGLVSEAVFRDSTVTTQPFVSTPEERDVADPGGIGGKTGPVPDGRLAPSGTTTEKPEP